MTTGVGTTNVVAMGAVASPWWMSYLVHISDLAAVLLPILGAAWLLIQIANFFWPRNDVHVQVATKGAVTVKTPTDIKVIPAPEVTPTEEK